MCEKLMVGPDKPVIPEQRLFQTCQLSPAGNIQNLSGTPPPLYTRTKATPTKHSTYNVQVNEGMRERLGLKPTFHQ